MEPSTLDSALFGSREIKGNKQPTNKCINKQGWERELIQSLEASQQPPLSLNSQNHTEARLCKGGTCVGFHVGCCRGLFGGTVMDFICSEKQAPEVFFFYSTYIKMLTNHWWLSPCLHSHESQLSFAVVKSTTVAEKHGQYQDVARFPVCVCYLLLNSPATNAKLG